MTEFDEWINDRAFPDRDVVTIKLYEDEGHDAHGKQSEVFVFETDDASFAVVPFFVPGDSTFEFAIFDADGNLRHHRAMSVMAPDIPFVVGGDE